jgi:hypothetical protein
MTPKESASNPEDSEENQSLVVDGGCLNLSRVRSPCQCASEIRVKIIASEKIIKYAGALVDCQRSLLNYIVQGLAVLLWRLR